MAHGFVLPHAKAADERIFIAAETNACGKLVELLGVTTTEHDIVGLHCLPKLRHDIKNILLPLLSSQPIETALAEVVFVGAPLLIREMGEFHWLKHAIDDHG